MTMIWPKVPTDGFELGFWLTIVVVSKQITAKNAYVNLSGPYLSLPLSVSPSLFPPRPSPPPLLAFSPTTIFQIYTRAHLTTDKSTKWSR